MFPQSVFEIIVLCKGKLLIEVSLFKKPTYYQSTTAPQGRTEREPECAVVRDFRKGSMGKETVSRRFIDRNK
jgi:hypothetical protein